MNTPTTDTPPPRRFTGRKLDTSWIKPFMQFDSQTVTRNGYVLQTPSGMYLTLVRKGGVFQKDELMELMLAQATVFMSLDFTHIENLMAGLGYIPKAIAVRQSVHTMVTVRPLPQENAPVAG